MICDEMIQFIFLKFPSCGLPIIMYYFWLCLDDIGDGRSSMVFPFLHCYM
jgi:hypothetical protein